MPVTRRKILAALRAMDKEDKRVRTDEDSPYGICSNSATWLKQRLGGEVYGYFHEDNPTAEVGATEEGHDFLVLDNFIVDWWYSRYYGDDGIYDRVKDKDTIARLYGDPTKWELGGGSVCDSALGATPSYLTADRIAPLTITQEQIARAKANKATAIIWMHPGDFLKLTTTVDEGRPMDRIAGREVLSVADYNRFALAGETTIMPTLDVNADLNHYGPIGQVVAHEGRHRAGAVLYAGGPESVMGVAIVLRDASGSPWYYTSDEHWNKRFTTLDDIPRTLYPQRFVYHDRQGRKQDVSRVFPVHLDASAFDRAYELHEGAQSQW